MEINYEDILFIVYLIGAAQGLILTVLLFSTKTNKIANRLLGLLTLMWAFNLCTFAFALKGVMGYYPHLLRTVTHIEFTFFPLLFLNIVYLLNQHEKFRTRDLLHFIPFIFIILLFVPFYFETAESKIHMVRNNTDYYYYLNIISDEILALQGIIYSVLSLKMIDSYNSKVLNYQSNNDKILLKYTQVGILILLIAWTIGAIAVNLNFLKIEIDVGLFIFTYLLIVIVIYIISYTALKSEEIFKMSDEKLTHSIVNSSVTLNPISENRNHSVGDSSEIQELDDRLIFYMNEKKPFLNPDLSLQDMADGLGVGRHQISAIINQMHDVNFYEFINTFRLNEVKKNLKDPEKRRFTIISLAFDAGFNSKASFNRIFKQFTHQTPSEYLNSLKSSTA